MTKVTDIFGGPFVPVIKHVDPPELQLADSMRSAGIDPPVTLKIDGQMHRFTCRSKR